MSCTCFNPTDSVRLAQGLIVIVTWVPNLAVEVELYRRHPPHTIFMEDLKVESPEIKRDFNHLTRAAWAAFERWVTFSVGRPANTDLALAGAATTILR
jgi:hypothetical protein